MSKKHDQNSFNLINVFNNFMGQFSNYIGFDKIKWPCAFTKYTIEKFIRKPQSTSMS